MRYPTSKSGLALPPNELGFEIVPHKRRETTNHHNQWERKAYAGTRYRQIFRNLVSNVYTLSLHDHEELHEIYSPPVMPKDIQMIDVVEEYLATYGVIDLVREKRTQDIYQVTSDQWDAAKRQFRSGYGIQPTGTLRLTA